MEPEEIIRHQENLAEMLISWLIANPNNNDDMENMRHTYMISKDLLRQKTDPQTDPRFS